MARQGGKGETGAPRNHVGVAVSMGDGLGQSLIATRSFAPGDVILVEDPIFLVVDEGGAIDYEVLSLVCEVMERTAQEDVPRQLAAVLSLWLKLSDEDRAHMLAHFSTPDESGMGELCATIVSAVRERHEPLARHDASELTRALLVWLLSAHATISEKTGYAGSAIFALGHRCNHSCSPNAVYVPRGEHQLSMRALKPIRAHEPVTISYLLAPELLMPSFLRQKLLLARKCFRCKCARCLAAASSEPERALPCDCGGSRCLVAPGAWRCGSCDSAEPPSEATLERERELCDLALRSELRTSAANLKRWAGHWVFGAAHWAEGSAALRASVEGADREAVERSALLVSAYFAWAEDRHSLERQWVAAQAAETYLLLRHAALELGGAGSAIVELGPAATAAAMACKLCPPYLAALEAEYGKSDAHNAAMRDFFGSYCSSCGRHAKVSCVRCGKAGSHHCVELSCQRSTWPALQRVCVDCSQGELQKMLARKWVDFERVPMRVRNEQRAPQESALAIAAPAGETPAATSKADT